MTEGNWTRDAEQNSAGLQSATGTEAADRLPDSGLVALVLSLLCLQSALFLGFVYYSLDTSVYLRLHLALCGTTAAFGLCWVCSSSTEEARDKIAIVLLLVAWTTLAGPFGTLITAALLVPRNNAGDHAGAPNEVDANTALHSERWQPELLHGSLLDRRLRLEHAHSIRPLLDVLIDGTQAEKFNALSLIFKRYAADFAPALRRALKDKDSAVRVLAATVTAQQNSAYTKRIGALRAIAKAAPECFNHWSALGQAHLDYAESGLLPASLVDAEKGHASVYLARAEQLDPGNAVMCARFNAVSDATVSADGRRQQAHELPKYEDRFSLYGP